MEKAVLNACPIKIILPLEEDEARLVQKELNLSEEETMQIIRSRARRRTSLCRAQPYRYCHTADTQRIRFDHDLA